jgi:membrane-associated HD superfamily phosphohydrolase
LLGEILGSFIVPNLEYNEAETEKRRMQMRDAIPPAMIVIERGKPIVSSGENGNACKSVVAGRGFITSANRSTFG